MGMRIQQLKQFSSIPERTFPIDEWNDLVFMDTETFEKRVFQIRRISMNQKFIEEMNPNSVIANLLSYFQEIQADAESIHNKVCKKGCSKCCTNDFPISIVEFFAILRYIGIQYSDDFVLKIEKKSKISLYAPQCIFVDETDCSCKIYEIRPLICRKYGTYKNTDCPKLKETILSKQQRDTSLNTIQFVCKQYGNKHFVCTPQNIVYWFGKLQNNKFKSERMNDLYSAAYFSDSETFLKIFLM